MIKRNEVEFFLKEFKAKLGIWGILYLDDRNKNANTILKLELVPKKRTEIISKLKVIDFSEGPLPDNTYNGKVMWIFGKTVRNHEVYIKITLGYEGSKVLCISFHIAEHPMKYPFK